MKYVDKIKGEEDTDEIRRTWSLEFSYEKRLRLVVETPFLRCYVVSIDLTTGELRRWQGINEEIGLKLDGDKAIVVGPNV